MASAAVALTPPPDLDLERTPRASPSRRNKKSFYKLGLTQREFEVVARISRGENTKDIARDYNCSIKTIQAHRYNIYQKMEVHTSSQLVLAAINYMRDHHQVGFIAGAAAILEAGSGID